MYTTLAVKANLHKGLGRSCSYELKTQQIELWQPVWGNELKTILSGSLYTATQSTQIQQYSIIMLDILAADLGSQSNSALDNLNQPRNKSSQYLHINVRSTLEYNGRVCTYIIHFKELYSVTQLTYMHTACKCVA